MPFVIALGTSDSNFDPSIYDNRPEIPPTYSTDKLPISPIESGKASCYGCISNQACIPFETRLDKEQSYCSSQGKIKPQLTTNSECMGNYECISNNCINNKCVNLSIWNKFISWIKNLF